MLKPHHKNFNKRLVKTPKLYFYDTALVCHLLGIESAEHLQAHIQRGAIFEGFILAEIIKFYFASGEVPPLFFWRDHLGTEVDALLEKAGKLLAIEIKSTMTFTPALLTELKKWQKFAVEQVKTVTLVYAGNDNFRYHEVNIIAWNHCFEWLRAEMQQTFK